MEIVKYVATFIKFEEDFFQYMRVKYKQVINNTFYDDLLPLDNEMELKGLCFQLNAWHCGTSLMSLVYSIVFTFICIYS